MATSWRQVNYCNLLSDDLAVVEYHFYKINPKESGNTDLIKVEVLRKATRKPF